MTVQRDDRGEEVAAIQKQLIEIGYKIGSADGIFGLLTDAAVRDFQYANQLEPDGIVGPMTNQALANWRKKEKITVDLTPVFFKTPYFPQRDNKLNPSGSCNVTSLAMVMAYHGQTAKSGQLEDELYVALTSQKALDRFRKDFPDLARKGYSPRHVTPMLLWLAREYGFETYSKETFTYSELVEETKSSGPFFTSGGFTSFGHIVCVTGFTSIGDWIVHDPWGDWNRGYRNSQNGKYRIYSKESMSEIIRGAQREQYRASFLEQR